MAQFTDSHGRTWSAEYNLLTARKVELECDLNPGDVMTAMQRVTSSPRDLGMVLWSLLQPQAELIGLTPETLFGVGSWTRDDDAAARDFVIDWLVEGRPSGERRVLADAVAKERAARRELTEAAVATLDS